MKRVIKTAVALSMSLAMVSPLCYKPILADESEKGTESSLESNSEESENTTVSPKEKKLIKVLTPESSNGKFKLVEREQYPIWKEFEKLLDQYGLELDLEVVNREQYKNTIQTRLNSSTDLPDFANIGSISQSNIAEMGKRGLIRDLKDMLDLGDGTAKKFFTEGKGKNSWSLNTFDDGSVYWISQVQEISFGGQPKSTNMNAQIRKDWLDKVGLDMPSNIDELYEALLAFQEKDVNGNGQKDEVVTIDFSNFNNGVAQWFGLVNDMTSLKIEDGKFSDIISPWHQKGLKDYFLFLRKLHDAGLLDPTVIGSTEENKNIENNKASMIFNYTMATWNEPKIASASDALYLNFGGLDAKTEDHPLIISEPASMSYGRWGFTSVAKDDEAIARLLDFLCSDKYAELTYLGIEGVTYEIVDGRPKLLPIAGHDKYEEAYKQGIVIGDYLWANGGCFPKRRYMPMENEIETVRANYPLKADQQEEFTKYEYLVPTDKNSFLPVANIDQMNRMSLIATDLTTRSQEISASLVLGDLDIEDLDSLVAELDDLGLTELIQIDQERLDRARELGIV